MKHWDTVGIIGVGLIGGSIGLALRERGLAKTVVGIGRRASSLQRARRRGAVTTTTTRLARGVAEADLIAVCVPVEKIADHVAEAAAACPPGALITDAGSIKGRILEQLELRHPAGLPRGVQFVGAHPMAGGDKSGPEHARADLFQDSACIVTPHESVGPRPLRAATTFWKSLGCRVVPMTADRHDSVVAAVSHVPHLVAAALAGMARAGDRDVVGSGWLDTTRIAAGNADLWRQILSGNRPAVLKSLDKFEKLLHSFREALESEDDARLEQLLAAGRDSRLPLERPQASSTGHGSRNT